MYQRNPETTSMNTMRNAAYVCRAARHYKNIDNMLKKSLFLPRWAFKDIYRSHVGGWPIKERTTNVLILRRAQGRWKELLGEFFLQILNQTESVSIEWSWWNQAGVRPVRSTSSQPTDPLVNKGSGRLRPSLFRMGFLSSVLLKFSNTSLSP